MEVVILGETTKEGCECMMRKWRSLEGSEGGWEGGRERGIGGGEEEGGGCTANGEDS